MSNLFFAGEFTIEEVQMFIANGVLKHYDHAVVSHRFDNKNVSGGGDVPK